MRTYEQFKREATTTHTTSGDICMNVARISGRLWHIASDPDREPYIDAKYKTNHECRVCGQIVGREKLKADRVVVLIMECYCASVSHYLSPSEGTSTLVREALSAWDTLIPEWLEEMQQKRFSDQVIRLPKGVLE
jgi:hypothetical protein